MKKLFVPEFITDVEKEMPVLVRKGYSVEKVWEVPRPRRKEEDDDDLPFETAEYRKAFHREMPKMPVRHIWTKEELERAEDMDWLDIYKDEMVRDLDDAIACLDEEIARLDEEEKKQISYNLILADVETEHKAKVRKVLRFKTDMPLYEINDMLRDMPRTIYCKSKEEAEELLADLDDAGAMVIRNYHDRQTKSLEELVEENRFEAAFKAYVKNCDKAKLEEMLDEVNDEMEHREKEEDARKVWIYSTGGHDEDIMNILHENACMDLRQAGNIVRNLPDYIVCRTKGFAGFLCRRINEVGGIAETGAAEW